MHDVDAQLQAARMDGGKVLAHKSLALLGDDGPGIEPHVVEAVLLHLEVDRAGHDVARRQLQPRIVRGHEPRAAGVTGAGAGFAGELIQVRDDERDWEGAAERLLRGFGLALLVPEDHYTAVAQWVESVHLRGRLVYFHVRPRKAAELLPTPDAQPLTPEQQKKKDDDQKARLEQILADIRAGKLKFDDAAKQFSDDKGSGAQGGELPWAGKNSYVPEFERAEFALVKVGDISPLVKTQFGWHIIKLLGERLGSQPRGQSQVQAGSGHSATEPAHGGSAVARSPSAQRED